MPDSVRATQSGAPAPIGETSDNFLIVAIGASAGGLEACRKLFAAMPPHSGSAFILVQHLDPNHDSMMADLLASHTAMTVAEASDGARIQPDHLYIIPPGAFLSVEAGILRLSPPQARSGVRLPFDFLLNALAADRGKRAVCVILSGTGADGSLGLKAIKDNGGLVIAQNPDEARYGGMPRNAITTGRVDLILPLAQIPAALLERAARYPAPPLGAPESRLSDVIDILRAHTPHDFTLYKQGTLERRIARRMAMAELPPSDMGRYVDRLVADPEERMLLARDLLINVTGFFRDPAVYDTLATQILPDLVRARAPKQAVRVWVAGCSSGEEAYSLAILFREAIAAANLAVKLQIFASDVDAAAIAAAREGLYPETIRADVSAERIARFFSKEDRGYRVSEELRSCVVFTVQDILTDPPFSRLDLVSCRNLLIYLRPEAQVKVLAVFHFALEPGGLLLLGTSETVGAEEGRYEAVDKNARIYRHVGCSRPGDYGFARAGDTVRAPARQAPPAAVSRQAALADLCRRMVLDSYAPAAVLINRKHETLFSMGPTERFLRVPSGPASLDLLGMVSSPLRSRLRAGIRQAAQSNAPVELPGCRGNPPNPNVFTISLRPVRADADDLLLVCFIDEPRTGPAVRRAPPAAARPRIAELEQELEATRTELQGAIHSLEISGEEQKAITEEALSVQEEYQSTNEELLTSKEELQSLNEELTALNSQLQETLERQRHTANDLQNVLYSTDVATLFLDKALNIRFFTPMTKALFNIIPGDIGRPLSDLNALSADAELLNDARTVLRTLAPIEHEIETANGACYIRRVMPYRTQEGGVEGVVITFADITDRRQASDELAVAKRQAEQANAAKSRFLAAASHDLRQPLQTLALVHGLLAKNVDSDRARKLVMRLDQTLGAMSGMLNTLLDINQIESGNVNAEVMSFPVNDLLNQLRDEFVYHAQAKGLTLRVVSCGLWIESDPRLLEQIIRNLVSNALKYTKRGKVLLGCRRRGDRLRIEVWDTGIGIADSEMDSIFEEYHQVDNAARERSRGLGLGLSIVQRLATLLNHPVRVRSRFGKGSVFAIDVGVPAQPVAAAAQGSAEGFPPDGSGRFGGAVLVVEDDPDVRDLLEIFLRDEGHTVTAAADGTEALHLSGAVRPDIVLADYNLPNGMSGVAVVTRLREMLNRQVPAIILTGDISTERVNDIALRDCVTLTKPVKLPELTRAIRDLLPLWDGDAAPRPARPDEKDSQDRPVIFVIDDDDSVRDAIRAVLEDDGREVEDFATCEDFLARPKPNRCACVVIDAYLPGMTGLQLLRQLHADGHKLPAIMITGNSDVAIAVQAMKAGALDFIEKPVSRGDLLDSVDRALEQARDGSKLAAWRADAATHIAGLTQRQRQIMEMVLAGHPSKNIAADLGISQRTVENHRASIMAKTGSKSLPALARLALAADQTTKG